MFILFIFLGSYKNVNFTNCININNRNMCKTLGKMQTSDVVDSCFNNFLYMSGGKGGDG